MNTPRGSLASLTTFLKNIDDINELFRVHRWSDAIPIIKNALTNFPDSPLLHYFYAQALQSCEDYAASIEQLKIVIELEPDHTEALNDLGVLYHHAGETEKAIEFLRRAVQISDNSLYKENLHLLETEIQRVHQPAPTEHREKFIESEALVSVIIPLIDSMEFLPEAIESVFHQSYKNMEIMIIEPGELRIDRKMINSFIEQNSQISVQIIRCPNSGRSAALNFGIKMCDGKYYIPLNQSDRLAPEFITHTLEKISYKPKTGFVYTDALQRGTNDDIISHSSFKSETILFSKNTVPASVLVKKEMWEDLGGYDEKLDIGYENWDFWIGCIERGWDSEYLQEPLFLQRAESRNQTINTAELRNHLRAKIILKHPTLFSHEWLEQAKEVVIGKSQHNYFSNNFVIAQNRRPIDIVYLITNILGATGGNQTLLRQVVELASRGHRLTIITKTPREEYNGKIQATIVHVPTDSSMSEFAPECDVAISTYFMNVHELLHINAKTKIYFAQGDQYLFEDHDTSDFGKKLRKWSDLSYTIPVHILVNSHGTQKIIEERYNRNASILPVAIDHSIYRPHEFHKSGIKTILIIGPDDMGTEVEPLLFKGIVDIREALVQLHNQGERFRVIRMSNMARSIFKDFECDFYLVPKSKVKEKIFNESDIMVYASHYDSCPLPPLEAMASGIAVVCTNTPGAMEYCEHEKNCLLVPIKNPKAIASAVTRLLHDNDLRFQLIISGIETAKYFSWKNQIDQLEKYIFTFLKNDTAQPLFVLPETDNTDPIEH